METFRKSRAGAPAGFFDTEAAGLRWLTVDGGPRVARVLETGPGHLDLERLDAAPPTAAAARAFGGRLATLHDAGAPAFGALPPDAERGWFGPLDDPLDMPAGAFEDWPTFYAEARLRPIVAQGLERGVLGRRDAEAMEAVCRVLPDLAGPPDSPARLHGDLWSGNLMWTADDDGGTEAALIDPAAHGGHRETDLAMLALFGAPHLDEIVVGYDAVHPLAAGWEDRVALHQLYPLAVHAVLFGGGYVDGTRRSMAALGG
ncbi:fructosamine kinase family protein [Isoptericola sp. 178]|uniref:fructosamine kinase family protein n=1 Tax=Isoptericola sp. 178 TaxID=3064651 RepID=UPI00271335BD|nr:fructosamine kinase family protein [Isoptericola sp. 178]MDO8145004.1 fructosamine kinase family protein [Isoptericola sp. 178]